MIKANSTLKKSNDNSVLTRKFKSYQEQKRRVKNLNLSDSGINQQCYRSSLAVFIVDTTTNSIHRINAKIALCTSSSTSIIRLIISQAQTRPTIGEMIQQS
jgi:hypothetical protein